MQLIPMRIRGNKILVEIDDEHQRESVYRGKTTEIVESMGKSLDELLQMIVIPYCEMLCQIIEQIEEQSYPPKKIVSEFGLQLNAEGNLYIARVSGQSSINITIEWGLS